MIDPLVLVLTTAVPALDAFAGDHILIRPGHECPIALERDLPDSAALAIAALDAGQFEVLSSHDASEAQATLRVVGGTPPSPSPSPVRGRPLIRLL